MESREKRPQRSKFSVTYRGLQTGFKRASATNKLSRLEIVAAFPFSSKFQ